MDVQGEASVDADAITIEWLTGRHFSFHSDANLLAPALTFERNGLVGGYTHPNETSWQLEQNVLAIFGEDGTPSCVALPQRLPSGVMQFNGPFLLNDKGHVHSFTENPDTTDDRHVRSFDLFDTLVARRCKDPLAVFALVERVSGVTGFAVARRQAELRLVTRGDYDFDGIYLALAQDTGWSAERCAALQACELAMEWEQLFPIGEIVARVGLRDLIVSDMYLPLPFIRRIVEEKCGLPGRTIHLTTGGKHHGTIWPQIARTATILRHHGDNPHSDVRSATAAGIPAELITVSGWSRGEKVLLKAGLAEFATAIRVARLSSFAADARQRRAQLVQLDVNLPLLVLASVAALQTARLRNADTLLMCSRDCNLWIELMTWMAERSASRPEVRYFTTSRVLLLADDPDYAAYYDSVRGERTMLVDVSGTGRSPAHFLARFGRAENDSIFIILGSRSIANFIEALTAPHDEVALQILSERRLAYRLGIECLNMSLDQRSMRVHRQNDDFRFSGEPNEFGDDTRPLIAAMRDTFLDAMRHVRQSDIGAIPQSIAPDVLSAAIDELLVQTANYADVLRPIMQAVADEEPRIVDAAFAARARNQDVCV